jgi:hypothetical protein
MIKEETCAELERILDEIAPFANRVEFFARIDRLSQVEDCIRDGLVKAVAAGEWARFERYVLAATRHPSRVLTPVLCGVLTSRPSDVNLEDVVEALGVVADPASVGCLVETILWEPDWDEYRQLAVKCVWALGAIASAEAIEALRGVGSTGPQTVRDAAIRELTRLEAR